MVYFPILGVIFCRPYCTFETSLKSQFVFKVFCDGKMRLTVLVTMKKYKEHTNSIINLKYKGNVLK